MGHLLLRNAPLSRQLAETLGKESFCGSLWKRALKLHDCRELMRNINGSNADAAEAETEAQGLHHARPEMSFWNLEESLTLCSK